MADKNEDEDCSTSGWCAAATLPRLPTLIQSKLALPRPPTAAAALSVSTATSLLLLLLLLLLLVLLLLLSVSFTASFNIIATALPLQFWKQYRSIGILLLLYYDTVMWCDCAVALLFFLYCRVA